VKSNLAKASLETFSAPFRGPSVKRAEKVKKSSNVETVNSPKEKVFILMTMTHLLLVKG
jgi:hypothetical protein